MSIYIPEEERFDDFGEKAKELIEKADNLLKVTSGLVSYANKNVVNTEEKKKEQEKAKKDKEDKEKISKYILFIGLPAVIVVLILILILIRRS